MLNHVLKANPRGPGPLKWANGPDEEIKVPGLKEWIVVQM